MGLIVHPLARVEIDQAVDHYREISPRLARRFRNRLDDLLNDIVANPQRWTFYEPLAARQRWRRCVVKGFPYVVIYEEVVGGVRVIAVPHASRKPDYWNDRD